MKLLLDLGNSRLKWALTDGLSPAIQARGFFGYDPDSLQQMQSMLASMPVQAVSYASVVDAARQQAVIEVLPSGLMIHRMAVTSSFGKLKNAYGTPETLGIDRWAAAIGAWHRSGGACLIISAGTATTIDLIDTTRSGGIYRGGLILPGIDLMLQSLHQGTARLPDATGRYRPFPEVADNTRDAMMSGAIDATCGAIERMGNRLPERAPWLLTGGRAPILEEALGERVEAIDDLVLEGLALVGTNEISDGSITQ